MSIRMLMNTRNNYGLVAQILHWATAGLILALIPLGVYMLELPAEKAAEAADKFWFYSLHKTLGVAVFFVAIAQAIWASIQPHPVPLNSNRKLENLAAQTVHWILYGAIIAMPLTGWLSHSATEGFAPIWWPLPQDLPMIPNSPALASFFGIAHFFTAILLGLSISLHIAGALKHALVDRDDTLRRMIPWTFGSTELSIEDHPARHFRRLPIVLAALAFGVAAAATLVAYRGIPSASTGERIATSSPAAPGVGWMVDMEKSTLAVQVMQSGQPISGTFQSWSARIILDPQNMDEARIDVEVDVSSLAIGSISGQAISPDFLNAKAYPVARFSSSAIMSAGGDTFIARGDLTLAGLTRPLTLSFRLTIEGRRASATGEATIDRLVFGVGVKGFPGGGLVGVEVLIQVAIEAVRPASS